MNILSQIKIGLVVFCLTQPLAIAEPLLEKSAINELSINNLIQPAAQSFSSGQPSPEQLASLAKLGIKHIINLRPKSEQTWDEAMLVQSLGMSYHHIAVAGAAGISNQNAQRLEQMLNSIGDEPVLVHCASGNRVGGLIAFIEAKKGKDIESAIKTGQQWGLTRLEPLIRKKLNENKSQ